MDVCALQSGYDAVRHNPKTFLTLLPPHWYTQNNVYSRYTNDSNVVVQLYTYPCVEDCDNTFLESKPTRKRKSVLRRKDAGSRVIFPSIEFNQGSSSVLLSFPFSAASVPSLAPFKVQIDFSKEGWAKELLAQYYEFATIFNVCNSRADNRLGDAFADNPEANYVASLHGVWLLLHRGRQKSPYTYTLIPGAKYDPRTNSLDKGGQFMVFEQTRENNDDGTFEMIGIPARPLVNYVQSNPSLSRADPDKNIASAFEKQDWAKLSPRSRNLLLTTPLGTLYLVAKNKVSTQPWTEMYVSEPTMNNLL